MCSLGGGGRLNPKPCGFKFRRSQSPLGPLKTLHSRVSQKDIRASGDMLPASSLHIVNASAPTRKLGRSRSRGKQKGKENKRELSQNLSCLGYQKYHGP